MTTGQAVYADRIAQNPAIMAGKPVIKGTRIPIERVIAHLAHNPDLDDLLAAYPRLTIEDVKAALGYAHDAVAARPAAAGSAPASGWGSCWTKAPMLGSPRT